MDVRSQATDSFIVYSLSEYAVTIQFDDRINVDTLERIRSFNTLLHRQPFAGFRSTVPAYATLSVYYDPFTVMQANNLTGVNCFQRVSAFLQRLRRQWSTTTTIPLPAPITIPVCYGGTFGPDLDYISSRLGIDPPEIVRLHGDAVYQVYLIGFTPGFAYLGGMPEQLAVERKVTPRGKVAAGSVGIAGQQTGIYPLESPGGWQIIGRTPLRLFDVHRDPPMLLNAGDRVVFRPMDHEQFAQYASYSHADYDQ